LETLDEVLFTNVDVSAGVLSTLFTNLATNQSIQDSLRAEINEWKARTNFDVAKYMAKSDALLNHIVMESMRHSPAFCESATFIYSSSQTPRLTSAGFSMPECTAVLKTIGGYLIPVNTAVVIDTRRLNNEAVTWGPDSTEFKPERFADLAKEKLRCGFMRFGTGAASGRCLGKNIADVVFKLTAVSVVEQFSLSSVADGKGGSCPTSNIRLARL